MGTPTVRMGRHKADLQVAERRWESLVFPVAKQEAGQSKAGTRQENAT